MVISLSLALLIINSAFKDANIDIVNLRPQQSGNWNHGWFYYLKFSSIRYIPCGEDKLHSFLSTNKVIGETNWKTIASEFFLMLSLS